MPEEETIDNKVVCDLPRRLQHGKLFTLCGEEIKFDNVSHINIIPTCTDMKYKLCKKSYTLGAYGYKVFADG